MTLSHYHCNDDMMFLWPLKGESDTATVRQGHKVFSTSDEEMPRDDPSRVGKKDCMDTDEAIATDCYIHLHMQLFSDSSSKESQGVDFD